MILKAAILSLVFSVSAHAAPAPTFSAFASGDTLFVTVLADSCNGMGASLDVDPFCKDDRKTRNLAPVCEVGLVVRATRKFCNDSKPVARVLELSLAGSKVAREAHLLKINYSGQQIEVRIDR